MGGERGWGTRKQKKARFYLGMINVHPFLGGLEWKEKIHRKGK